MASQMAILRRTVPLLRNTLFHNLQSTSSLSSTALSQDHQLATDPPSPSPSSLPPNPASGSPFYNEHWRSPLAASSLIPLGHSNYVSSMSPLVDAPALMNNFADLMTSQHWTKIKEQFELWIRSLDQNGKPNRPDVGLYNHYLRANLMLGATAADLLDLVSQMELFDIVPNTASFNLVFKAMSRFDETDAAQKLLQRMLQTGKESLPDDDSYGLLAQMLFRTNQIDDALKYVDMALNSGRVLSMKVFGDCVWACVSQNRLDALVSIIEKCKKMDQNKALCPMWPVCTIMAEVAMQEDNTRLAFYSLEFMAMWIARGEKEKPSTIYTVDEGLVVSMLCTAARNYNQTLLDASWAILGRSLRQKKVPSPECFLGKINAHTALGDLRRAFSTLREFETAYGNSSENIEIFSPFTSLHPLVIACSKKGFETLDLVYFQLENLSRADTPYKSVAALNCVILGCANIWDLDRAYQTFEAIGGSFGLTPDVHSYNALMYAFGKFKKTFEASRVFEHMVTLGVKPNAMSYSLLVDAHLINRDQKTALTVIDDMVSAGFTPQRETMRKVRRRCIREMDTNSDAQLENLMKNLAIRLGAEKRRNALFDLQYNTS